ncbi:MAG: leucyl aminopeptidase [Candidatus Babeliales bacterium]
MITITLTDKPIHQTSAKSIALFVEQDTQLKEIKGIAKEFFPALESYLKEQKFSGQEGKVISMPLQGEEGIFTLFIIGLGKIVDKKGLSIESFRRSFGSFIKLMQQKDIASCALHIPAATRFKTTTHYLAKQVAIIAQMAVYRFDEYITDVDRKVRKDIALELTIKAVDKKEIQEGLDEGFIIAHSVNKARHWIDLPPSALTPTELANKAKAIATEHQLLITIFDEATIKKMGMGGLAAVSAGSEQDCRFVVLEYKAAQKNVPTIALVGKGITFDSGGLSIKPAQHMETMKEDMSGAAAVIGAMEAIAQLKPKVNVIGITPLSENLPSDKATKPGDIVTFYNGKTAEVKNTDAEGRLILADALSYAVKHYKPDAMIDIATLTGACAYALGPFFTGMMGKDNELLTRIKKAADISGDRVWELPFDDDYKKSIVSSVADICNIGKPAYQAGAITAGFFLSNFVGDTPWVHLDIAGTAFNVPDISYYEREGATGVGVRLFVELLLNWQ